MKLSEKLIGAETSKAMKSLVSRTGWKLIEEAIKDKKLQTQKHILLKKMLVKDVMQPIPELQLDIFRQQIIDMDWLLNYPNTMINEQIEEIAETIEEKHLEGMADVFT